MGRKRKQADGTWADLEVGVGGGGGGVIRYAGTGMSGYRRITSFEGVTFDVSGHQSLARMFYDHSQMVTAPFVDTSQATDVNSMFQSCSSLISTPTYDLSNATNVSYFFYECSTLTQVPPFNLAKATKLDSFAVNCKSLTGTLPLAFPAATILGSALRGCSGLAAVDLTLKAGNIAGMDFMFDGCTNLTSVSFGADSLAFTNQNFGNMFRNCTALTEVPPMDLGRATAPVYLGNMFDGCTALTRAPMKNVRTNISVANTAMGAEALNELFTGLATVTGQTVTITGTPGAATCDRSIAEAKGWTVTG